MVYGWVMQCGNGRCWFFGYVYNFVDVLLVVFMDFCNQFDIFDYDLVYLVKVNCVVVEYVLIDLFFFVKV